MKYTFEIEIEEGSDEFWEEMRADPARQAILIEALEFELNHWNPKITLKCVEDENGPRLL